LEIETNRWALPTFSFGNMMDDKVIAIDGPAGSGKSTAARRLSQALDFRYLNTGAMYRAVALIAMESGIDLGDPAKGDQIAAVARKMRFEYGDKDGQQRFIVNGQDRTDALFTVALTGQLKPVVNHPAVREALVEKMRGAAHEVVVKGARGVVLEGRDIGTVVFPDAPIKFYIHADLDARTTRRAAELEERGDTVDYAGLRKQIQYRDETDKGREVGALKQAADAIDVDTTHLDEEATLRRLITEVRSRGLA
jgi:CMP/dCMP kinase